MINCEKVTCKLFAPDMNSFGIDLKAWDFQSGKDNKEPAYIDILRKFYNVSKCDDDYKKEDLIQHDPQFRNIIWNRCKGQLKNAKYSLAIALENSGGNILSPTVIINTY